MDQWSASFDEPVARDADLHRDFERRVADSSSLAFRVAYGVLRHRQDAEDVAQEAFLRAYRGYDRLRDRDQFRPWLVRIAWRLALNRRRSTMRREHVEQMSVPQPEPPQTSEEMAISGELHRRLHHAVDELPEKLRLVVVLAGIEGHSVGELATLLGLPEGTVKSRLHLARRRLMESLSCSVNGTDRP
jgi:RNA polymerase sigma-70 factor (ECF subfamily)